MNLNLKANNEFQEAILEHLKSYDDPLLEEKIKTGGKDLAGCQTFIIKEARKKAHQNTAIMRDDEVFGLAVHFFEEDEIKQEKTSNNDVKIASTKPAPKETKREVPKAAALKDKNEIEGQMSLFSLLGSEA